MYTRSRNYRTVGHEIATRARYPRYPRTIGYRTVDYSRNHAPRLSVSLPRDALDTAGSYIPIFTLMRADDDA